MGWYVLLAVLAAGALAAAYALLARIGRVPPVAQALAYAAALVVAAHLTGAIVAIDELSSREVLGGETERAILQIVCSTAADIAWQAGLLVAAAALILRRPATAAT